jgi:branched-chain amino acid transport system permease protein
MRVILEFSALGLGEGALIAGVALALVIFYRGSGTINLAAGCVAMVTGYTYWSLKTGTYGHRFSTVAAVAIAVAVSALQGVLFEFVAFRPLRAAPPLAKMVASLGLFLVAQSAVIIAFGPFEQSEPSILPQTTVTVFGVPIGIDEFILAGIVLVSAVALASAYRWTGFGIRTRAAAENEGFALLAGLSPKTLSLANSVLACLVAGLLGMLAAPLITLDSTILPLLVVPALAAAMFARFTSFLVAAIAGLLIGALENVVYYASTRPWFPQSGGIALPGVTDVLVFILIVVAAFVMGGRLPDRGDLVERRLPLAPRPRNVARWTVAAIVVVAAALTVFPFDFRQALMLSMSGVVLSLSFVVTVGFVGQVSVVPLALSGGAAFLMAHLANSAGLAFPIGPIVAVAATTMLGVLVALGGLRLRGVQLAAVSLAAAVAISDFWFANGSWGAGPYDVSVAQPTLFGLKLGSNAAFRGLDGLIPSPILGYGIVVVTALLCVLVCWLRRSRLGLEMLAVRANERAAAGVAIDVARTKVKALAISAFLAGVAGVLASYTLGYVSGGEFGVVGAFTVIAFAYIGGISRVAGAVIAGLWATEGLAQYFLQKDLGVSGTWVVLTVGCAVLATVIFLPFGLAALSPSQLTRSRPLRAAAGVWDRRQSRPDLAP